MSFKGKRSGIPEYEPKEGYEKYASVYDRRDAAFLDTFDKKMLMKSLRSLDGQSVMDVGVGTGRLGALLRKRNAKELCGFDISPAMLEMARKKALYDYLVEGDIQEGIPESYEGYFDMVISSLLLVCIPHRYLETAVHHMRSFLKPGGLIYLVNIPQRRSPRLQDAQGEVFYISSYHHADDTVADILLYSGFDLIAQEETKENGVSIATLFIAQKKN